MELIADGLLFATAITAAFYCFVLSRRLQRLTDSGAGIGAQIEALDKAMGEVRAALSETKSGVSELRGSAQTAATRLTKETARADEMAERLDQAVRDAKATMERLYEAGDRIEAYETRAIARAAAEAEAAPKVMLDEPAADIGAAVVFDVASLDQDDAADLEDDTALDDDEDGGDADFDDDADEDGSAPEDEDTLDEDAAAVRVALPEGRVVAAIGSQPMPAPARAGATLKVERMML